MKLLLGVSGGISVYKAVELLRIFKKHNHEVNVIMTPHAAEFVQPLTFQVLSGNPVRISLFSADDESKISHIELAQKSDAILVVPATANTISKAANGLCDDLLSTVLCASSVPVILSPAMNTVMWENSIICENVSKLKNKGYHFIPPEYGDLACETVGKGRTPAPEDIYQFTLNLLTKNVKLKGKRILITAGPTVEPIDSFRYISNYSSGKMGYALAKQAGLAGAKVTLISGPVHIQPPPTELLIQIQTAKEMYEAVMAHFSDVDIVIKTAAVSDFSPKEYTDSKLKKDGHPLSLELVQNVDTLKEIGKIKKELQFVVGFAAETENLISYAREKLTSKNSDLIIANEIGGENSGFGGDSNNIYIVSKNSENYYSGTKTQLADIILSNIIENIESKKL